MLSMKGKVAIVTGASRGIGKAISRNLAECGVNLALNSRSLNQLEAIKEEFKDLGIDVLPCPADLRDPEACVKIVEKVAQHFGKIDILINNAGIAIPKPLNETTVNEWDMHMVLNARAPFLLSREALPYLKKSEMATVINISSVVGYKGYINQGAYTASKHALMGMTKVFAQEVFKDNVRVHIIAPGGVATDMVANTRPDLDESMLATPQEIADVVMFILTHRGNAVIDEINIRRFSNTPWK
jgi:3-oxoacyl-[acyl-carrier protein] reductase